MAVYSTTTAGLVPYIQYSHTIPYASLPRSAMAWVSTTGTGGGSNLYVFGTNGFTFRLSYDTTTINFVVSVSYSTTPLVITKSTLASSGLAHIGVSITNTTTASLYLNGAAVSAPTIAGGTGAIYDTGANPWVAGNSTALGGAAGGVGNILSVCYYNRVISAQEMADAYSSKMAVPTVRGLLFSSQLEGAAGAVTDGTSLGTSNTFSDRVSGNLGTPNIPSGTTLSFGQDSRLIY